MLGEGKTLADARFPPKGPKPLTDRVNRNDLTFASDGFPQLHFTDVTESPGIAAAGYGIGMATGDMNNDGWVDLYVTNFGPNQMFRNNGDGTFTDVTHQTGTDDSRYNASAAFVDFDRDGWLDLFVSAYVNFSYATHKKCFVGSGRQDYCGPLSYSALPDRLYRNRGDGIFEDHVSARSQIVREYGQAATDRFGVMGNPDIAPQRTVTYQFGYKQALTELLGLDLTAFYKDIRDLLGVEIVTTYNDARYARYTNVDFGNVIGFTVALDQRAVGLLSATLDYTWQIAQGNSSDPNETATRTSAGQDARPRQIPFNWDQRHTLNLTATAAKADRFNVSSVVRVASGQPYTPNTTTGFGSGQEANSGRKPLGALVDLRGEYVLARGRYGITGFARVFNVFDTRYFNGAVFETTGSPYYSRFPGNDERLIYDATRLYDPRRIELGLSWSLGGS